MFPVVFDMEYECVYWLIWTLEGCIDGIRVRVTRSYSKSIR